MPTQKARFTPFTPRRSRGERMVEIRPLGGLHAGVPPQELPEVFSPALQNIVPDVSHGWVRPRSGISKFTTHDFGGVVLGADEIFDVEGASCAVAASARSLSFLHPDNQAWSYLSYLPPTYAFSSGFDVGFAIESTLTGAPSGSTTDYFRTASIYDAGRDATIAVTSNNSNAFFFLEIDSATTTFSNFTFPELLDSTYAAKDVASVNDRLVFFNTRDKSGTRYPTRVMWSARGNPTSFLINDGAGFEDLMDMRGAGQAAIRFRDFIILFTEYEIWRGTPTFDAYAFRFDKIADNVGCPYPRTIAATPNGVIFLARDREVYATDGSNVVALGPVQGQGPSRIQDKLTEEGIFLERAWAVYDSTDHAYELYYPTPESTSGFPDKALIYHLEDTTWWPLKFSHEFSAGADVTDPAAFVSWDELNLTWDDYSSGWDDYLLSQGNRRLNLFTSDGTGVRVFSTATNDLGTEIDARWRSKGFRNGMRRTHLAELWIDHESENSSEVSVFAGDSRPQNGQEFVRNASLATTSDPTFIPLWKTGTAPDFEIRLSAAEKPKFAGFSVTLRDAGKF